MNDCWLPACHVATEAPAGVPMADSWPWQGKLAPLASRGELMSELMEAEGVFLFSFAPSGGGSDMCMWALTEAAARRAEKKRAVLENIVACVCTCVCTVVGVFSRRRELYDSFGVGNGFKNVQNSLA